MTAYNRAAYIGDAIESVLASDYQDFEVIVVDDCSDDDTYDIAKEFVRQDRRIHLYRNSQNLGDYVNRNAAAKRARGRYLKYVDSDDRIYAWGLGAMVHCMERYPAAGLGLATADRGDRPHPVLLPPREAYLAHFLEGRDLFGRAPGSAIIRRSAFEACGGFTGVRQVGDHEFWLILARRFPVITLPRDLTWDRVHGAQELALDSEARKAAMHFDVDRVQLSHPDCPLTEDEVARALRRIRARIVSSVWRRHLLRGKFGHGFTYIREAGLTWPELIWSRAWQV